MKIRRYEDREDARGVARVQALAWRAAYADLLPDELIETQNPNPNDDALEEWHDFLIANRRGVLVAVADCGTVRGFADVRWGDAETKAFVGPDEADLKAIYVDPAHWGEGIGTALLERALDALPALTETLRLEMLAGNEVGRRFYEARQFERTGETSHEIGGESYPTVLYSLRL